MLLLLSLRSYRNGKCERDDYNTYELSHLSRPEKGALERDSPQPFLSAYLPRTSQF